MTNRSGNSRAYIMVGVWPPTVHLSPRVALELNPDGHAARNIAVGTAYSTSRRIWYTLDHGGVTEIYYPTSDSQRVRVLQFLGAQVQ